MPNTMAMKAKTRTKKILNDWVAAAICVWCLYKQSEKWFDVIVMSDSIYHQHTRTHNASVVWCGVPSVRPIFHKFAIIGNSNVSLTLTAHQIVFDFRLTDKEIKSLSVASLTPTILGPSVSLHIEMAERAFIGCVKRIFTDYHKWRVYVTACVWWTTTEEINIDNRFIIRFDKRVDSMSGNTKHTSRRIATAHPHTHPRSTRKNLFKSHSIVYCLLALNAPSFQSLSISAATALHTLRISWRDLRQIAHHFALRRIHDRNSRAPKIKVNNFGRKFIYFLSGKWCFVNRNSFFFSQTEWIYRRCDGMESLCNDEDDEDRNSIFYYYLSLSVILRAPPYSYTSPLWIFVKHCVASAVVWFT